MASITLCINILTLFQLISVQFNVILEGIYSKSKAVVIADNIK